MNNMYIEYECGCTSEKTTDNQKYGNHIWAEAVKIILNGDLIYSKIYI